MKLLKILNRLFKFILFILIIGIFLFFTVVGRLRGLTIQEFYSIPWDNFFFICFMLGGGWLYGWLYIIFFRIMHNFIIFAAMGIGIVLCGLSMIGSKKIYRIIMLIAMGAIIVLAIIAFISAPDPNTALSTSA